MSNRLSLLLVLAVSMDFSRSDGAVFHVSPSGDDSNNGSEQAPFATPARAQVAARSVVRRERVKVILSAGTYYLQSPLIFSSADSGRGGAPGVFFWKAGGEIVFSGG
jgi:hypothetical protein